MTVVDPFHCMFVIADLKKKKSVNIGIVGWIGVCPIIQLVSAIDADIDVRGVIKDKRYVKKY